MRPAFRKSWWRESIANGACVLGNIVDENAIKKKTPHCHNEAIKDVTVTRDLIKNDMRSPCSIKTACKIP